MVSYQSNWIVGLVLVAAFAVLHESEAQSDIALIPRRYCGRVLSTKLISLCSSVNYNRPSDDTPHSASNILDSSEIVKQSKSKRNTIEERVDGSTSRPEARGLHEECCRNKCTEETMMEYCF